MEIRAALEHGSMASLDQGSATMNAIQQLFKRAVRLGYPKAALRPLGRFRRRREQPVGCRVTDAAPGAGRHASPRVSTTVSQNLTQQRADTTSELGATVSSINTMSQQIAQLNKTIKDEHALPDSRSTTSKTSATCSRTSCRKTSGANAPGGNFQSGET